MPDAVPLPVPEAAQGPGSPPRAFIAVIAAVGAALSVFVALGAETPAVAGTLAGALAIVVALHSPPRITIGSSQVALTFEEAVLIAGVVVLPPMILPGLLFAGTAASYLIRGRGPERALYNAGASAIAASAGVAMYVAIAPNEIRLTPTLLAAMLAMALAFEIVALVLLSLLYRQMQGSPFRDTLNGAFQLAATTTLANFVAALPIALAAAVDVNAIWLLPLLIVLLHAALNGYERTLVTERRSSSLRHLALTNLDITAADLGAGPFLVGVGESLDAEDVTLWVKDVDDSVVCITDPTRPMTDAVRAALTATEPVLSGNDRALAIPLDGRRGVLAAGGRTDHEPWSDHDVALLQLLSRDLATTLENRELFVAIRQEERRLREVLDASSDGIVVLNLDGDVVRWNQAMARITGVEPSAAVDEQWHEVIRTATAELSTPPRALALAIDAAALGTRIEGAVEVELLRPSGEERVIDCSVAPVMPRGDEVTGVVVVARDISAEREVDGMKADFVAVVSHELRTPLTPLRGFLQTFRERFDVITPDQGRTIVDAMWRQIQRLDALVADLLAVADLDAGTMPFDLGQIDLAEIVSTLKDVEDSNDRLRIQIDEQVAVEADRAAVLRIARALVSNGLKHSQGDVHVTVSRTSEGAVIQVQDDGPGIAPWDQERIFDRFVRVGDHLSWTTQGPGLGLTIARSLADRLGGTVSVSSDVGAGATFTLTLPLDTSASSA